MSSREIEHGEIKILFTPDEEIGRGVDKVDLGKLGARYAYTLDGSERGSLEDETFSADSVKIIINGISAHPGYAKGKMVNAVKVAGAFLMLCRNWDCRRKPLPNVKDLYIRCIYRGLPNLLK
jgi:tripeptide aminopeptidase